MGLATIDTHSQKVQIKLYKIPKFDVNRPNSMQDIELFENVKIYKEMYGQPDVVRHSVRMVIHFVNFDVFKYLYLSQN